MCKTAENDERSTTKQLVEVTKSLDVLEERKVQTESELKSRHHLILR